MRKSMTAALMTLMAAAASGAAAQDAGDVKKGESLFARCRTCHSLDAGTNKQGPSFHGLFGRKAGSVPGYAYSPAMKKSDTVWEDDTLAKYISNPHADIPGNKMPFNGLTDADQVKNLLAYLKDATK